MDESCDVVDMPLLRLGTGDVAHGVPTMIVPSVSAVVVADEGWILLERRRDNGHWGLPGGALHPGESVLHAVIREVHEETALRVVVQALTGVYSDPMTAYALSQYAQGLVHYVNLTFYCTLPFRRDQVTVRLSDESTAVCWFPPERLPTPTLCSTRQRVEDALHAHHASLRRGWGMPRIR